MILLLDLVSRRVFGATAVAAVVATIGCNALTGADDANAPAHRSAKHHSSGDGGGGAGGVGGAGDAPEAASGVGGTSGSTSGPSASASTGGGDACGYPGGPYGAYPGKAVSPSYTWKGFADASSSLGVLHSADYFDCDGSKGIRALLIDESAAWCGPCKDEAADVAANEAAWASNGIRVVTLMIQDGASNPATTQTAQLWREQYGLTSAVGADPYFSFAGSAESIGLPLQLLVDPRTMKIVERVEGYPGDYAMLEALAQQNAD